MFSIGVSAPEQPGGRPFLRSGMKKLAHCGLSGERVAGEPGVKPCLLVRGPKEPGEGSAFFRHSFASVE